MPVTHLSPQTLDYMDKRVSMMDSYQCRIEGAQSLTLQTEDALTKSPLTVATCPIMRCWRGGMSATIKEASAA